MTPQKPTSGLGAFTLLRGKLEPGQCPECAVIHEPYEPHDWQSLFYQYSFMEQNGRWPTWDDAMAHCSPEIQTITKQVLAEHKLI